MEELPEHKASDTMHRISSSSTEAAQRNPAFYFLGPTMSPHTISLKPCPGINNTRSYRWAIPEAMLPGTYRLAVASIQDPADFVESTAFEILAPKGPYVWSRGAWGNCTDGDSVKQCSGGTRR